MSLANFNAIASTYARVKNPEDRPALFNALDEEETKKKELSGERLRRSAAQGAGKRGKKPWLDRFKVERDQVRNAKVNALAGMLHNVEKDIPIVQARKNTCRHPLRDAEAVPVRSPKDQAKAEESAILGEKITAQAVRFGNGHDEAEIIAEIANHAAHGHRDYVSSLIEACQAKYKKLPVGIAALAKDLEEADFFGEKALQAELEGLESMRKHILEEFERLKAPLWTEEEIARLEAEGLALAGTKGMVPPWLDY